MRQGRGYAPPPPKKKEDCRCIYFGQFLGDIRANSFKMQSSGIIWAKIRDRPFLFPVDFFFFRCNFRMRGQNIARVVPVLRDLPAEHWITNPEPVFVPSLVKMIVIIELVDVRIQVPCILPVRCFHWSEVFLNSSTP